MKFCVWVFKVLEKLEIILNTNSYVHTYKYILTIELGQKNTNNFVKVTISCKINHNWVIFDGESPCLNTCIFDMLSDSYISIIFSFMVSYNFFSNLRDSM